MRDLLWKKHSRTPVKLSTIKERFGQKITGELLCLESGFSAVGICVECADRFFDIFIDIGIVRVVCIQG